MSAHHGGGPAVQIHRNSHMRGSVWKSAEPRADFIKGGCGHHVLPAIWKDLLDPLLHGQNTLGDKRVGAKQVWRRLSVGGFLSLKLLKQTNCGGRIVSGCVQILQSQKVRLMDGPTRGF